MTIRWKPGLTALTALVSLWCLLLLNSPLWTYLSEIRPIGDARDVTFLASFFLLAGLATNLERVTAQDQRLRTALALENAELDLGIFRLDLLRATGTLHSWLGLERPIDPEGERAETR